MYLETTLTSQHSLLLSEAVVDIESVLYHLYTYVCVFFMAKNSLFYAFSIFC